MRIELTHEQYEVLRDIVNSYEVLQILEGNKSYEDDIKRKESFKKGDYVTYIGGSTSKYLIIGKRYRLTGSPFHKARRVCVINDAGKRMNLRSFLFEF